MDTKNWHMSKTIWGAVIALVCTGLRLAGVADVSTEEQASLADSIVNMATMVGQLGGMVLAIYGRVKAEKSIG